MSRHCTDWYILLYTIYRQVYTSIDILLCAGFRGAHRDAMMHEPSTAPEPQGWGPEEEDHSPCPQDHGDEEYSAGPDAASMEGAISKFMEGLADLPRAGTQWLSTDSQTPFVPSCACAEENA